MKSTGVKYDLVEVFVSFQKLINIKIISPNFNLLNYSAFLFIRQLSINHLISINFPKCLYQEPSRHSLIALLKLSRPVHLGNPFIQTIALAPQDDYDYTGGNCYYCGWGHTECECFSLKWVQWPILLPMNQLISSNR